MGQVVLEAVSGEEGQLDVRIRGRVVGLAAPGIAKGVIIRYRISESKTAREWRCRSCLTNISSV